MTDYRYAVHDLTSGDYVRDLDLFGVTYSEELNGGGDLSASLDLRVRTTSGKRLTSALLTATEPRLRALYVIRDGVTVSWAGIIWRRRRSSSSPGVVQLTAIDFWSYFGRRRLTVDKSYTATDQLAVARDLIDWAQAQPGGDVGVQVGAETSGVTITREPLAYGHEYRTIAELIEELAGSSTGFDLAIVGQLVDDVPVPALQLFYPRRGRRANEANLVFFHSTETAGNLRDYDLDEDGLDSVTTLYAVGAGEGSSMLRTVAWRTDLIDAGYPLTEDVGSYKAITDGTALQALNIGELSRMSDTAATWTLDVDPDDDSVPFGSWTVGDDVRISISDDDMFPVGANGEPGIETTVRIIGQTVTVPDDGGSDRVTLRVGPAYG